MKNFVLESNEPKLNGENFDRRSDRLGTQDYANKCRNLTGSDMVPPVFYKGRTISAGKLGERSLG